MRDDTTTTRAVVFVCHIAVTMAELKEQHLDLYVDSNIGDDVATGKHRQHPLRSLGAAQRHRVPPLLSTIHGALAVIVLPEVEGTRGEGEFDAQPIGQTDDIGEQAMAFT